MTKMIAMHIMNLTRKLTDRFDCPAKMTQRWKQPRANKYTCFRSCMKWTENNFCLSWILMRGGAIVHFAWGQLVKTFKIFFRTEWSVPLKLSIQHWALKCYQDCSNDDPTCILTFLYKSQLWFLTWNLISGERYRTTCLWSFNSGTI